MAGTNGRRTRLRRAALAGAFATAVLLGATACGDSGNLEAAAAPPVTAAPAGQTSTGLPPGIRVVKNATLGDIVTDTDGRTLYRFDQDTNIPPATKCTADCLTKWPAAAAVSDTTVQGIDQNLVALIKRPEGTEQVTLNGWPLYYYSGDKTPGETNGQGTDGVWYATTPDGSKAGVAATATTTAVATEGTSIN